MQLTIFHYHVLPGGVTGVIDAMAEAIDRYSDIVDSVVVVSGSEESADVLRKRVRVEVLPEIGYTSRQRLSELAAGSTEGSRRADDDTTDPEDASDASRGPIGQVRAEEIEAGAALLSRRLADTLLERWGGPDTVWWVHNHHLGKNPAFTRALIDVSRRAPDQRIVFHIHDFPECGRYNNLRFLRQAGIERLYPDRPNLTYVTINSRDRDVLQSVGLDHATYLPNPVRVSADRKNEGRPEARSHVRTRLANAFDKTFAYFSPDHRLFLYPVRTIRRKNIFEAALVVMLGDEPSSLIVTLPGVSQAEKAYSQMVRHAFRDGTIPGLWGIGGSLDDAGVSFSELQANSDAIISSSVQEGFGYQFITPLLQAKPLIARRLDVLHDIEPLYERWPHAFYRRISVPSTSPSLSGPQALLRFRYTERIDRLASTLPAAVIERLHHEVDEMMSADTIDFSFLMPHMQYTYLKDLRADDGFKRHVAALNRDLLRRLDSALNRAPESGEAAVARQFGLPGFARRLDEIVKADRRNEAPRHGSTDSDDLVLRAFATLDYQRLLYE
ncbi:MAG: hypothetical protein MI724_18555 [Spirochaetales bacterium]|nr:hypothetical protein [Spirochaetales bacterium]